MAWNDVGEGGISLIATHTHCEKNVLFQIFNFKFRNLKRITDPSSRGISSDREWTGRTWNVLHTQVVGFLHPLIDTDCNKGAQFSSHSLISGLPHNSHALTSASPQTFYPGLCFQFCCLKTRTNITSPKSIWV